VHLYPYPQRATCPTHLTAAQFPFTQKREIFRQAEVQSASQEGLHSMGVYAT
jgi:hypothetical protein